MVSGHLSSAKEQATPRPGAASIPPLRGREGGVERFVRAIAYANVVNPEADSSLKCNEMIDRLFRSKTKCHLSFIYGGAGNLLSCSQRHLYSFSPKDESITNVMGFKPRSVTRRQLRLIAFGCSASAHLLECINKSINIIIRLPRST